jgi:single-strand DNA-binding protein
MANFNINKVILGGRLTADPELKQTPNGVSVCQISLAVNRRLSKEGERQADFINCVAWRNTAEFISKYFRKGSSLCVVGQIQIRSWTDSNGQKRYATEVLVDEALFVDGKNDTQGSEAAGADSYIPYGFNTPITPNFTEQGADDDLPF